MVKVNELGVDWVTLVTEIAEAYAFLKKVNGSLPIFPTSFTTFSLVPVEYQPISQSIGGTQTWIYASLAHAIVPLSAFFLPISGHVNVLSRLLIFGSSWRALIV